MQRLLIENPPQIHNTIVSPIYGMADDKFINNKLLLSSK